jgi:hypothetical protein
MDLPPPEHHVWQEIVCGRRKYQFENLAVRILQGALARSITDDPSPENLLKCANMMRSMFVQNISSPSIRSDLQEICSDRNLDAL